MNFSTFYFNPQINAGIVKAGYSSPTPIQAQTIPAILSGNDVLGLAQTGTGKTAAFVLPILQRLMTGPRGKLRALIVAPTRELAEQTYSAIQELGRQTGLRALTVYGGVSSQGQIRGLRSGVDIVVACPGRLLDLKDQRIINLSHVEILVLDEADQLFDMGFLPDVRKIIKAVPEKRQTLLFSATMPAEIRKLATEILHNPVTVEISITKPLETISHVIYNVDQLQKSDVLVHLLRDCGNGQVLVFTRTKHRAKKLAVQLDHAGFSATSLQGNLSQSQRTTAMNAFRTGRVKVLVATDIAARGIDVSQITHVINFDLPVTVDAYTHRTGRTGRMEHLGTALSLVTQEDMHMVKSIERHMGKNLERRKLNGYVAAPKTPGQDQQAQPRREQPRTSWNNNRSRSYSGNR